MRINFASSSAAAPKIAVLPRSSTTSRLKPSGGPVIPTIQIRKGLRLPLPMMQDDSYNVDYAQTARLLKEHGLANASAYKLVVATVRQLRKSGLAIPPMRMRDQITLAETLKPGAAKRPILAVDQHPEHFWNTLWAKIHVLLEKGHRFPESDR